MFSASSSVPTPSPARTSAKIDRSRSSAALWRLAERLEDRQRLVRVQLGMCDEGARLGCLHVQAFCTSDGVCGGACENERSGDVGGRCVCHQAAASSSVHGGTSHAASIRSTSRADARTGARVFLEALQNHALEIGRNELLGALRRRNRRGPHMFERHAHGIRVGEDERSGQQDVRDASERVQIGACVDRRARRAPLRAPCIRACPA